MYKDDYIIRILDQHRNNRYGFVKLYPTGIISLHMFRKEPPEPVITFQLDTALFEEAKYFAKEYINNHYDISRNAYVVDDGCFFDGFRMNCGFAWIGNETIDYESPEFFKEKSEYSVINKIMDLPQLSEFTNVKELVKDD